MRSCHESRSPRSVLWWAQLANADDEILERIPDRDGAIEREVAQMQGIQVDDVGAGTAKARFAGCPYVLGCDLAWRCLTGVFIEALAKLGGQNDLISSPFERFAEDAFASAGAVDIGGIEERDPEIQRAIARAVSMMASGTARVS